MTNATTVEVSKVVLSGVRGTTPRKHRGQSGAGIRSD